MAITTGSYGTLKYAWEETYANLYSSGNQSSPNKKFGIQDKVSSWTIGNNRIDLAELNQTEYTPRPNCWTLDQACKNG